MIYFAQSTISGLIKIGFTRGNVRDRLKQITSQTGHPMKLMATFPGKTTEERALHGIFWYARVHGEWFQAVDMLKELIDAIKKKAGMGRQRKLAVQLRLAPTEYQALANLAKADNRSLSGMLRKMVLKHLDSRPVAR